MSKNIRFINYPNTVHVDEIDPKHQNFQKHQNFFLINVRNCDTTDKIYEDIMNFQNVEMSEIYEDIMKVSSKKYVEMSKLLTSE